MEPTKKSLELFNTTIQLHQINLWILRKFWEIWIKLIAVVDELAPLVQFTSSVLSVVKVFFLGFKED